MKRAASGRVWGELVGHDGTRVPILDERVARMLEAAQRDGAELAEYRIAWQQLVTRHNRLERCWWARLGRRLRLAPAVGRSTDNELRVAAAEVRRAMEAPGPSDGAAPESPHANGIGPPSHELTGLGAPDVPASASAPQPILGVSGSRSHERFSPGAPDAT